MPRERPIPLNEMVRDQFSKMPRRDTKPELALRSELHGRGLRFRRNFRNLPGSPDIAFTRARLAVFVDGCFWHGCRDHFVAPKNNATWWEAKIDENRSRDRRVDESLVTAGWIPLHIWEHEPVVSAADTVEVLWKSRTGR